MNNRDDEIIDTMARAVAGTDNEDAVSVSRAVAALALDALRAAGYVVSDLPDRYDEDNVVPFSDDADYVSGWNDCLDAILAAHTAREGLADTARDGSLNQKDCRADYYRLALETIYEHEARFHTPAAKIASDALGYPLPDTAPDGETEK